jgi:PAS domain S-box-containing protein
MPGTLKQGKLGREEERKIGVDVRIIIYPSYPLFLASDLPDFASLMQEDEREAFSGTYPRSAGAKGRGIMVKDKDRTKEEPNQELAVLKKRVAELEKTLQNERETFGTIIQKSPYGILLLGEKGKFLYINPEFVRITGYALEDVPTGKEWFLKAFPDENYRNKALETWKTDMAANIRGSARVFHISCRDGSIKVLEFRATRVDEQRAMVMLTDITDRKRIEYALIESEERFRILSDNSPVGIALARTGYSST